MLVMGGGSANEFTMGINMGVPQKTKHHMWMKEIALASKEKRYGLLWKQTWANMAWEQIARSPQMPLSNEVAKSWAFCSNRTKKAINHDPAQEHWWVCQVGGLEQDGESSAIGHRYCLTALLALWLVETRVSLS